MQRMGGLHELCSPTPRYQIGPFWVFVVQSQPTMHRKEWIGLCTSWHLPYGMLRGPLQSKMAGFRVCKYLFALSVPWYLHTYSRAQFSWLALTFPSRSTMSARSELKTLNRLTYIEFTSFNPTPRRLTGLCQLARLNPMGLKVVSKEMVICGVVQTALPLKDRKSYASFYLGWLENVWKTTLPFHKHWRNQFLEVELGETISFRGIQLIGNGGPHTIHLLNADDMILATADSASVVWHHSTYTEFFNIHYASTAIFRRNECIRQCYQDMQIKLHAEVHKWQSKLDSTANEPVSCECMPMRTCVTKSDFFDVILLAYTLTFSNFQWKLRFVQSLHLYLMSCTEYVPVHLRRKIPC